MEAFVRYIVAGGVAMVAGLWIVAGFEAGAAPWLLGAGLAVVGGVGVLYGIVEPLEY